MEREELEQVPWSSLTASVDRGADRRWYAIGGLVVAVVVAVIGFRYLATPGQPTPPPVAETSIAAPTTVPTTDAPPGGTLVVAEDQLRTAAVPDPEVPAAVVVRAEWFVMDYFTLDGSAETARSVREALAPSLGAAPIPHDTGADAASAFVEWARVLEVTPGEGGSFVATVAYRSIRGEDGGFVRDPVVAVALTIRDHDGSYLVATLPSPTALPAHLRPGPASP